MTVHFEAQLSRVRTAVLWDLSLDMQPCLTSSALLSMAASAASLLASVTLSTTHSLSTGHTALLDTVASGPQQLPSTSQMTSCSTLQLSVVVATGLLSISCNGANLMQSSIAQTGTYGAYTRAAAEGPAGDSPGALACLLPLLIDEVHVAKLAAALAHVTCQAQDESGYNLHPAVFEMPVSLAALAAQPGQTQPTWLRSAAATLLPTGSATTWFVASEAPASNKAWSMDHQTVLQQEGTVFASGVTLSAAEASVKTATTAATAAAAATGAAHRDATEDQEACDQTVSADSALLQMDSQERKLYIQAQVGIGSLCRSAKHSHCFML